MKKFSALIISLLIAVSTLGTASAEDKAVHSLATKTKFFSGRWVAALDRSEDCTWAGCSIPYDYSSLYESYTVKVKYTVKGYQPTFVGGAKLYSHVNGKLLKLTKFVNIFSNSSVTMMKKFKKIRVNGTCVQPRETLLMSLESISEKTASVIHRVDFLKCGYANKSLFANEYRGIAYKM